MLYDGGPAVSGATDEIDLSMREGRAPLEITEPIV
jgi:hypothetical protein